MQVYVRDKQHDLALKTQKKKVRALVADVAQAERIAGGELAIFFLAPPEMCRLHKHFLGDGSLTDCISLPLDEDISATPYASLGEIFVCPSAAIAYCTESGGDPYRETTLYIVHGLLHLLGYDDIDPRARRKMRQKERTHMERLESKGLLLSP